MNITIIGGGNIGTQFAVHCAEKNNKVIIYTSKPDDFSHNLIIKDENDNVIHMGDIYKITNIEEEAFSGADFIFVTVPAFLMKSTADKILPYVKTGIIICLVPGTGGGECAFAKCSDKGAVICGLQRVPSVARVIEKGKSVRATGYRNELHLAALKTSYTEKCCKIVEDIFDIKCTELPNYLNLTLTPSNPLLHTTRLMMLFRDYKPGTIYEKVPLFYEEWNNETSELLLKCDAEVQDICKKLDMFDLSYVKSLKEHYESNTPEELTNKIQSIKGFKGIYTPMIKSGSGYIPDFSSRYFTADFSYGLTILVQISNLLKLQSPNMNKVLEWYDNLKTDTACFYYNDYNISDLNNFIRFYNISV